MSLCCRENFSKYVVLEICRLDMTLQTEAWQMYLDSDLLDEEPRKTFRTCHGNLHASVQTDFKNNYCIQDVLSLKPITFKDIQKYKYIGNLPLQRDVIKFHRLTWWCLMAPVQIMSA